MIKPTRKTVRSVIKKLNLKPGINIIMQDAIKVRAEASEPTNRLVSIIFDEKAAKKGFQYDAATDTVLGFVDLGNGQRFNIPAEETMVCMIRSFYGNWKQPCFFWYTSKQLDGHHFAYCTFSSKASRV